MAVVCLFLFPTLVSMLSQLIRDKRLSFNKTEFFSWCFYSLIFVCFTLPIFFVSGQLTIKASYHDGIPMFSYTTIVPIILLGASIFLGIYFSRDKHALHLEKITPQNKLSVLRIVNILAHLVLHILLFAILLLTIGYFWAYPRYKNINLEEVFFYLCMPL